MRSEYLPVILLLGAKSTTNPLASIPAELSNLKALFEANQSDKVIPPFTIQYEPYFTQEQLKLTLDQLAGKISILHFAGHSNSGVLLSDDQAVNAKQVAAHISTWSQPPDLIFLNGCHNAGQVEAFHAAGVQVVIATHRAINDAQAAGFAREFYASLLVNSGQATLLAAFKRAGSKVLLSKSDTRQARSLDIEELRQDKAQDWDWSLFPRDPQTLAWTLRNLLTHERPRFDDKGELINPYRGLEAFREKDRAYFFGREALTNELCEKIPLTRLFALWGGSGSGKSSLISAGVIPRLRETGNWLILKIRPGNDPFRLLAAEIALVFHPDIRANRDQETAGLIEQLKNTTLHWPDKVADLLKTSGKQHLLLFIDQFEELFTQSDTTTVRAYEEQLTRLVEAKLPNCTLLLVMRADFLGAVLANEAFTHILNQYKHATELLPPMGQAELRAAIEQPARKQRVTVEPTLTAALLDAVESQPGSLPLLQYVLSLLWEQRRDNSLQLDDYNRFGGLEKALEIRASHILESFSTTEQEQAKHIFLRLIQPGEGSEDTRRRADLHEFGDDPAARHILKVLADARLITTQKDEYDRDAFAEVSHEALIRHWGKLREWIDENRDALYIQHQLSKGAIDWEEGGHDTAWLLTGSRLAVAQEWLRINTARASELEVEFVEASIQERDRLEQEKEQQRQRELVLQEEKRVLAEQSLKKTRRLSAIMTAIAIIMIAAAGFAWHYANQSQAATVQARTAAAESRQRELEANYNLTKVFEEKVLQLIPDKVIKGEELADPLKMRAAWLYGLDAASKTVPEGKKALLPSTLGRLSAIREQDLSTERTQTPSFNIGVISALTYSPDGKIIASGSWDKTVRLWDTATGKGLQTLSGHTASVRALAYSPDGKVIASGSADKTVRLWDALTGKTLKTLNGHTDSVHTLAYSPDGKIIASGGNDHAVRLWDATTGKALQILNGHTNSVYGLAYSSDGRVIASGSRDKTIRLWDAATGKALQTLRGHTAPIRALAYSPDGKIIASGGSDDAVRLWDATTGKVLQILSGHTAPVSALVYSSDGKVIASGSKDTTIRLWDTTTGKALRTLNSHTDSVYALAYSPNGKVITSGSGDATMRLWDATTGKALQTFSGQTSSVHALAYSPDGKFMASGGTDYTVQMRDTVTGKELKTLSGHTDSVLALAYSPDGKVIATGSGDKTVRLWDATSGKELKTLSGHTDSIYALSYSVDGKIIASGSGDRTIRLWDVMSGKELKTLSNHSNSMLALAYSPDGKVIASGGDDNTVRLWDAASGKELQTLSGHTDSVHALAYSPDGKVIASGGGLSDRTVRLWDVASGKELQTLNGHTDVVYALAYSPDGKFITSGSGDKTVRLWDAVTGKGLQIINSHTDSVLALAYSPNGKVIASGSADKTVRLWDALADKELQILSDYDYIPMNALAYSPDDKVIATSGDNNTVKLLDAATGQTLKALSGHTDSVEALAYSPDGKVIASGSWDETIRLWDAATGRELQTLNGHTDSVLALAYSPDGNVIASGSLDKTVRLWDMANGKVLQTLSGHTNSVYALAYSPDGKVIASGGEDDTVRLWDTATGKGLQTLSGHMASVRALAYSPNGKVIASGGDDDTVRLWDTATGKGLQTLSGHTASVKALAYSLDGKTIFSGSKDKTLRLWMLDSPVFRLIYDFEPAEVSAALRFVWEMERDELQIIQKPHPPALFPEMGYYITWTDETRRFRPLLDAPKPDETKLDQVVRFLEAECAYKDPKQKTECEKP